MHYWHKVAILTLVVRRNYHYSFGDSPRSIPQDPWEKKFNFSSFSVLTLVFRNLSLDLFKSNLCLVSVSVKAFARLSRVRLTSVPVTLSQI